MYHCGDIIDQYRLTKHLGSGSYGIVFEAENTISNQKCALKIIPLCGRAGARELRALRQFHNIDHPNLLKIHHSGTVGDFLYYTMDLADGKLANWNLSPAELRSAAIKLADALATLHENGLLHRDLKPDNLFLRNGEPLIGDIGLVTVDCGASLSGTPGFLSPSVQKSGAVLSEQTDLYALAKSIYCLLSGNHPGDYPKYIGPVDPDSSMLMQAILHVCDEDKTISSAAGFRDFLRQKQIPKRKQRLLWILGFSLLLFSGLVAAIVIFKPFTPVSRGEQMLKVFQKGIKTTSSERAAIDCQMQVFMQLLKEAGRKAGEKFLSKKNISSEDMMNYENFHKKVLEELVKSQAKKSPEFHCFFILWNEMVQESLPLYNLEGHPEYAEILEENFQRWQKKYKEYRKERDSLRK